VLPFAPRVRLLFLIAKKKIQTKKNTAQSRGWLPCAAREEETKEVSIHPDEGQRPLWTKRTIKKQSAKTKFSKPLYLLPTAPTFPSTLSLKILDSTLFLFLPFYQEK
jgi:hypothetical protein